jgi:hypothetical protein
VTLEVFDEREGDRVAERDRPFRGVDYDPRTDRVDIMLGELDGADGHHSHSVAAPRAIELLRRAEERDLALRIAGHDETATVWIT